MRRYILKRSVIDNSGHFHGRENTCPRLDRTLFIRFTQTDGGFMVEARGRDMPDWGNERYEGRLDADQTQIRVWVDEFLRSWHSDLVSRKEPSTRQGFRRTPATEKLDLSSVFSDEQLKQAWRAIAVAGRKLFSQLFLTGDDGLKRLGHKLIEALWKQHQVISINSNEVIVPWSMLYVPWPGTLAQPDATLEVNRTAFLGYRHLVEHTFDLQRPLQPDIPYDRLATGVYFDQALEEAVQPILLLLGRHANVRRGVTCAELEQHLRGPGADDHLLYFCCHSVHRDGAAALRLSGGEILSGSDLQFWLGIRSLQGNPLVIINACAAGEFGSHPPSHFGTLLFERGASSLLGPAVNIPEVVARPFAESLLGIMLSSKGTAGHAAWSLARRYVEEYHNPLGLSYSVFHGIDTHFCAGEGRADARAGH